MNERLYTGTGRDVIAEKPPDRAPGAFAFGGGHFFQALPLEESGGIVMTADPRPTDAYGRSKLAAEAAKTSAGRIDPKRSSFVDTRVTSSR